jgi:hypothetical protein
LLLVDYFSIRPPLYAWCILAFRILTHNIFALLVAQNILSILNCWLLYRFVKKHRSINRSLQLLFIAGICCYPAQMIHANFVMTELLFQSLLFLLFSVVYQFHQHPNWKSSFQIAALLSICLLTKPVSLFLPLLVVGMMGWSGIRQPASMRYLVSLVVVGAVFVGICLQNEHATGYFHYSSIKNINQLKYNARYTLINAEGEKYADSVIANCIRQANKQPDYGGRLRMMDQQAFEMISAYPVAFLKVYVKGVAAFFIDPGRFDLYHFFAVEEPGTLGLMHEVQVNGMEAISGYMKKAPIILLCLLGLNLCWNIFVTAAFLRFLIQPKISRSLRVFIFVFVAYIAAATGPVGVSRYRVPVYPFLLMGALFAVKTNKPWKSALC